jgi:hypothetical protein
MRYLPKDFDALEEMIDFFDGSMVRRKWNRSREICQSALNLFFEKISRVFTAAREALG